LSQLDPLAAHAHITGMADPRKPAATVVKIETTKAGERLTVRNEDGTTETLITSASSVAAIRRAAKTYDKALKELADE
jgi:hypothetical protein